MLSREFWESQLADVACPLSLIDWDVAGHSNGSVVANAANVVGTFEHAIVSALLVIAFPFSDKVPCFWSGRNCDCNLAAGASPCLFLLWSVVVNVLVLWVFPRKTGIWGPVGPKTVGL